MQGERLLQPKDPRITEFSEMKINPSSKQIFQNLPFLIPSKFRAQLSTISGGRPISSVANLIRGPHSNVLATATVPGAEQTRAIGLLIAYSKSHQERINSRQIRHPSSLQVSR